MDSTPPWLLAERDGRAVGYARFEFRDRLNWVVEQAWIPDLIVTADARGMGAGKALLARAFQALAAEARMLERDARVRLPARGRPRAVPLSGMSNDGFYFLLG